MFQADNFYAKVCKQDLLLGPCLMFYFAYIQSLMVKDVVSNSSVASFVDYLYSQGTSSSLGVDWFVEVDGMSYRIVLVSRH